MKRTAKSFPVYLDYSKAVNKLSDAEAGQLFKALLEYADSGQDPPLEGSLYAVFAIMQNQLDRDTEKYVQKCERLRQNGSKGGRPAKNKEPNENQEKPFGFAEKPKEADTDTVTDTDTDTVTDTVTVTGNTERKADKPPTSSQKVKKSFGEYGWVKLTEDEYNRLMNDLGEDEAKRCITYVDESAQSTDNKNKWRDWNLVVRRCHRDKWGFRGSFRGKGQAETSTSGVDRLMDMMHRGVFDE